MTGDDVSRMAAQILNGIAKDDSPLVTDEESSKAWDELVAEIEANPEAVAAWDIPTEWGQKET